MSEQVNKEQTKGAEQENITELTDQQLAEAQGGRGDGGGGIDGGQGTERAAKVTFQGTYTLALETADSPATEGGEVVEE